MKHLFSILLSILLLSSCMDGTKTIEKMDSDNSVAAIENQFVRVEFGLQKKFTWKKEAIDDELGSG